MNYLNTVLLVSLVICLVVIAWLVSANCGKGENFTPTEESNIKDLYRRLTELNKPEIVPDVRSTNTNIVHLKIPGSRPPVMKFLFTLPSNNAYKQLDTVIIGVVDSRLMTNFATTYAVEYSVYSVSSQTGSIPDESWYQMRKASNDSKYGSRFKDSYIFTRYRDNLTSGHPPITMLLTIVKLPIDY